MRVFFLTHRLPYAPNRGDRIRAFYILRTLATQVDLELLSLVHDRHEESEAGSLRRMGIKVHTFRVPRFRNLVTGAFALAGRRPLTHLLLDTPALQRALKRLVRQSPPDVTLAYCSGMARFAMMPPLSEIPLVLDLVDVDSEKWAALAPAQRQPRRWIYQREARHLAAFERQAIRQAHATLVVNEREQLALEQLAPGAEVHVVPNGIDLEAFRGAAAPSEEPLVIFCGVMNYGPNVDAVLWFARSVWPRVRADRPDARFLIVGAKPSPSVRRLAAQASGIEVTGAVPDVRPYLWRAAVSVAPLMMARGVQNKVLEAVAAGLPVVTTAVVSDGLPAGVRPACATAHNSLEFAERVLWLLAQPAGERRALSDHAELGRLSWDQQLSPLMGILEDAARSGRRAAP